MVLNKKRPRPSIKEEEEEEAAAEAAIEARYQEYTHPLGPTMEDKEEEHKASGETPLAKRKRDRSAGMDARFASTRAAAGVTFAAGTSAGTDTPSRMRRARGGTITTPMSTRKKARLAAMAPESYTVLGGEELEELFSKVRHNHLKKVERVLSKGVDPDIKVNRNQLFIFLFFFSSYSRSQTHTLVLIH